MRKWRWIRLDIVYAIHERQLSEHGGLSGVPNPGGLEAALARPKQLAAYAKPDAAALAAAYAYGILRNHPFADGNKRVAWVIARLFLADNRCRLTFDPLDAVRTVEKVAAGSMTERSLAEWFRRRIVRT